MSCPYGSSLNVVPSDDGLLARFEGNLTSASVSMLAHLAADIEAMASPRNLVLDLTAADLVDVGMLPGIVRLQAAVAANGGLLRIVAADPAAVILRAANLESLLA